MPLSILRILSYFITGPAIVAWANWNSSPMTTSKAALELGTRVVRSVYFGVVDFDTYSVSNVQDDGGEWAVWFSTPLIPPVIQPNGFIKHVINLKSGPEIHIDKSTGKITYWSLQR
jgi:hypothetical protein